MVMGSRGGKVGLPRELRREREGRPSVGSVFDKGGENAVEEVV